MHRINESMDNEALVITELQDVCSGCQFCGVDYISTASGIGGIMWSVWMWTSMQTLCILNVHPSVTVLQSEVVKLPSSLKKWLVPFLVIIYVILDTCSCMGNALSHFRCLFTVVNTASVHAKRRESMWCILWQRLCLGKQIPVSFCNLFTLNSIGYTSGRGSTIYNQ